MTTLLGEFGFDSKTMVNRDNASFLHLDDFRAQDPYKPEISDVAVATLRLNQGIRRHPVGPVLAVIGGESLYSAPQ